MRALVAAVVLGTCVVVPPASAGPTCPAAVQDAVGDTGHGPHVRYTDAPADIAGVAVAVTSNALTLRMSLAGQPDASSAVQGRYYDITVRTGEGSFVARAAIGNLQARYTLFKSAMGGELLGTRDKVQGAIGRNSVTMTMPLLDGLRAGMLVKVSGQTWTTVGDAEMEVGSTRTPGGAAATIDSTDERTVRLPKGRC